ncbi:hypothetical protein [Antribacter gilvus]|uniref:hypothetical protein n=1 Tax=Antribacter gilvus TaxID=2304675 RepID=UPI000F793232|nr:hypothetical protein [Antribacter gilvus]
MSDESIPRVAAVTGLTPEGVRTWDENFLLELRLLGVSGRRIGAAVAEVESHLAESGESAPEAFGDAKEYARSLGLSADPEQSGFSVRTMLLVFGEILLFSWVVTAAFGVVRGEPMTVTVGALLGVLVVFGLVLLAGHLADRFLRWLVEHPVAAVFLFVLAVAVPTGVVAAVAAVLPDGLFRSEVLTAPAVPALVAGLALLLGGGILWVRHLRRLADPVTTPFDAVEDGSPSGRVDG